MSALSRGNSTQASQVFLRIHEFNRSKRLQMELLLMFVKLIDEADLQENKEAFHLIDADQSGSIDVHECLAKIRSINRNPSFGI